MNLPQQNIEYSTREYWDARYAKITDETYDWFKDFSHFSKEVVPLLSPTSRIINLGCGNSTLAVQLYSLGFRHVTSIDYVASVIEAMAEANVDRPELEWVQGDCLNMLEMGSGQFDVALDKGTMDAFLAESASSWSLPEEIQTRVERYVAEVFRVVRKGGVFVYITFGQPHFRKPLLETQSWSEISIATVGDAFHYFVYTCKK